ncbi:uncharacterized protein si:ch211-217i17.1 [Danio rerio]|uniref:Uncharacterized protein si:ch211-217i17.1 n=1 Tax=Danio rerio TaxID=7955 RepID=A0AC58G2L3_DANRE
MGNKQSELKKEGYTVVSEDPQMMKVKDKNGDQFVIKALKADQDKVSDFLLQLNHPHIVHHKQVIRDGDRLYLVLEHCEGGDLAQKIKLKTETTNGFSEAEIVDWTAKMCMALKYLHDQQILHKNLQPKSVFFTACGAIRLGEFGAINEWSIDVEKAETKDLLYVPPEILSGKPYDEKSEVWSLGCIIYEMCMLKCGFRGKNTDETSSKILTSSYEDLPETFSEDLRELVKDTLQVDPANRPSVSEILTRPFIIKHLHKMSTKTIEELYKTLDVLEKLAAGLEKVHFNTTVSRLTGGVIGLLGAITTVVGVVLTPATFGASLIVTGVGIGVSTAGGVTAGVSNVTKMIHQCSNRRSIKRIITELQDKISSTSCCIQNIQIAVGTEHQQINHEIDNLQSNEQSGNKGIGMLKVVVRLFQSEVIYPHFVCAAKAAKAGKVAVQTARVVRSAEVATGVLSALFIAVDVFFVALDAREIHNLRKDTASREAQQKSEQSKRKNLRNTKQQELRTEIMKFVKTIRETEKELRNILDKLREELQELQPKIPN